MDLDREFEFRRSLRLNFCPTCDRRPPGSQLWNPLVVRDCECNCTLFVMIPQLLEMSRDLGVRSRLQLETALRAGACMDCHACGPSTADGDVACLCPLRLTDDKVDHVLDTIATPACGAD